VIANDVTLVKRLSDNGDYRAEYRGNGAAETRAVGLMLGAGLLLRWRKNRMSVFFAGIGGYGISRALPEFIDVSAH